MREDMEVVGVTGERKSMIRRGEEEKVECWSMCRGYFLPQHYLNVQLIDFSPDARGQDPVGHQHPVWGHLWAEEDHHQEDVRWILRRCFVGARQILPSYDGLCQGNYCHERGVQHEEHSEVGCSPEFRYGLALIVILYWALLLSVLGFSLPQRWGSSCTPQIYSALISLEGCWTLWPVWPCGMQGSNKGFPLVCVFLGCILDPSWCSSPLPQLYVMWSWVFTYFSFQLMHCDPSLCQRDTSWFLILPWILRMSSMMPFTSSRHPCSANLSWIDTRLSNWLWNVLFSLFSFSVSATNEADISWVFCSLLWTAST